MEKVVAFLEKYAEWVALSLASLFLLYMVYQNVVAPGEALRYSVGSETVFPGEVDPTVNRTGVTRLTGAMEAPAGDDLQKKLTVKNYDEEFRIAMSDQRPRFVQAEAKPLVPPIPGAVVPQPGAGDTRTVIAKLPTIIPPVYVGVATGNTLVAKPQPLPLEGEEQPAPAPENPEAMEANALDKNWSFLEWKLPVKDLAAAWKETFPKPDQIPPAAMETIFLQVEVEREELIAPGQWSNRVVLPPLPLVRRPDWPKQADLEAEAKYRIWAEANQPNIVTPPFYRMVAGDPWYIPSIGLPKDPAAADAAALPFDPASPPTDRELTPREKQLVYIHNQKLKEEKARQNRQSRPSPTTPRGSGRTDDGGRRIGGSSAPLPDHYAAGAGLDDDPAPRKPSGVLLAAANPAARRPTGGGSGADLPQGEGGASRRPPAYDDAGRPIGPGGRRPPSDVTGRRPANDAGFPGGQDVTIPAGSILTGPFDPTRIAPDLQGKYPDLPIWAYDDTAVPGKNYRYRVRVKLKNPIYQTGGLNDPKMPQLVQQFALISEFSPWKELTAPRTTEFFFVAKRQPIGGIEQKPVTHVTADVFKHERGKWTKESFVLTPGDGIGGAAPKSALDYSTGTTLVDLRWDTRGKDVHILVADATGLIETRTLDTDLSDPLHKALQEKAKAGAAAAAAAAAAAGGNGAEPPNGALINEVGARNRNRE